MTMPNLQARRATIEDLHKLTPLWQQEGLPADELSRRLQEFQVIETPDGEILGAVGLQIAGQEARLHSEAFARPEEAESVRALLWDRVQIIAKNHGLARLWTQFEAPFWKQGGFNAAPTEVLAALPPVFAGQPQPWAFLQLRSNAVLTPSVDKEFAIFKQMQQAEREQIFQRAKIMKFVALLAVLAVVIVIAIMALILIMKKQGLRPQ